MAHIDRRFYKAPGHVIHFLTVPVFTLLCILLADPYDLHSWMDMGKGMFTMNLSITFAIMIASITITRMIILTLRKVMRMTWGVYILWCTGEIVLTCLFLSIYFAVIMRYQMTYFPLMLYILLSMGSLMTVPYAIITLSLQLYCKSHKKPEAVKEDLVRFLDDNKKLRLIITKESVLYISAEENYVKICYSDSGKIKSHTLRSSMRALEAMLNSHGLVRCHRSYFINPARIRLVRKDSSGYALAELDIDGLEPIPVSKKYSQALSAFI